LGAATVPVTHCKNVWRATAALLRAGKIFEKGILAMLHELVGVLNAEIAEGTYVETRYDHSPENVPTTRPGVRNASPQRLSACRTPSRC